MKLFNLFQKPGLKVLFSKTLNSYVVVDENKSIIYTGLKYQCEEFVKKQATASAID